MNSVGCFQIIVYLLLALGGFAQAQPKPKSLGNFVTKAPFKTPALETVDPFWEKPKYIQKLLDREIFIAVGVEKVSKEVKSADPSQPQEKKEKGLAAKKAKKAAKKTSQVKSPPEKTDQIPENTKNEIDEGLSPKILKIDGVMWVNAYADKVFTSMIGLPFLDEMKDLITERKWNPKTNELFFRGSAYNYHARVWMEFFYKKQMQKGAPVYEIHWRHPKGVFKGMTGVMQIKDIRSRKSQVTMTVRYQFNKLPIPKLFVEFGMEVILQKMAEKLRASIEKQ